MLTKLLKEAGFTVVTAQSLPSALQWLHTEAPDAILLDQKFTVLNGLSSGEIIKEILPDAVVILVDPNAPNLSGLVQSVIDRLANQQANGAGAAVP